MICPGKRVPSRMEPRGSGGVVESIVTTSKGRSDLANCCWRRLDSQEARPAELPWVRELPTMRATLREITPMWMKVGMLLKGVILLTMGH